MVGSPGHIDVLSLTAKGTPQSGFGDRVERAEPGSFREQLRGD